MGQLGGRCDKRDYCGMDRLCIKFCNEFLKWQKNKKQGDLLVGAVPCFFAFNPLKASLKYYDRTLKGRIYAFIGIEDYRGKRKKQDRIFNGTMGQSTVCNAVCPIAKNVDIAALCRKCIKNQKRSR